MARADPRPLTRRRVCGLAGVASSVVSLAGCGGPEGEDDADLPAEEGTGNGQELEDDVGDDASEVG
ncbi:hypothetical protein [Natronobiforma cellulositropha]|uniref:hypothetical protein n=1 Tax=Natronobiforma cellulositropha TaxID=1679076 RepID=UPI0021D5B018|nr:hypothetical protein [Natronobiforma cellulositropha]